MIAAVAFDLDGTLVDSREDLAAAVNALRAELGLSPLELPAVLAMVGDGARALVERALGSGFPAARLPHATDRFLALYEPIATCATRPYPGVLPLLEALYQRFPLGVLTNKPERISRRILEDLGAARFFKAVVGGDSLPVRKPDPGTVTFLAPELGVSPAAMLLVGDSRVDAATAAAAGCPFALVAWGYADPAARERLAADLRVESAEELGRALGVVR